ncbi:MAG: hypothetical protein ACI965_001838 [Paraglaciecola sp.]|jgi:hypothetical protein
MNADERNEFVSSVKRQIAAQPDKSENVHGNFWLNIIQQLNPCRSQAISTGESQND